MVQLPSNSPDATQAPDDSEHHLDTAEWDVFCVKYGRGLRVLSELRCPHRAAECFRAVAKASIVALRNKPFSDEEAVSVIRANLRRAAGMLSPNGEGPARRHHIEPSTIQDLSESLAAIFTPPQLGALFRHYVEHIDAETVCREFRLQPEHLSFLTRAALLAAIARDRPSCLHDPANPPL